MRRLIDFFGGGLGGFGSLAHGEVRRVSGFPRRPPHRSNNATPDAVVEAATSAVMAAQVLVREADDEGPRVAVISQALGGAFYYCREEASRRVGNNFPSLDKAQARRIVALIESRVRTALKPQRQTQRENWINGWR